MVYYWNNDVYKRAFVCFVSFMAIFAMNFKVNSQELFRNKNEEANFIQKIYDLSYLVKKYYKEEDLDKLSQTIFIIQDYVQKVTGDHFYIEDNIDELDKKLQQKGKFLSKSRLNYIRDFFNEKRERYDQKKYQALYEFGNISFVEEENLIWMGIDQENKTREIKLSRKLSGAIAVSLCGIFFCAIPHPASLKVGLGLLTFGLPVIYNEVCEGLDKQSEEKRKEQIRIEQIRKEKEQRRREGQRDCSQCSKKCKDCPHCRKRQGW